MAGPEKYPVIRNSTKYFDIYVKLKKICAGAMIIDVFCKYSFLYIKTAHVRESYFDIYFLVVIPNF